MANFFQNALDAFSKNPLGFASQITSVFGAIKSGQIEADAFESQRDIALLNEQQILAVLPLQLEALAKEKESIGSAFDINAAEIEDRKQRAIRVANFGFESVMRSKVAITGTGSLPGESGTSFNDIVVEAGGKLGALERARQAAQGKLDVSAAVGGVRVASGSTRDVAERVDLESEAQRDELLLELDELEQQERELQDALDNALNDAARELLITTRNRDIALDRVDSESEILQARATSALATVGAQAKAFDSAARNAQINTALSVGGFLLDDSNPIGQLIGTPLKDAVGKIGTSLGLFTSDFSLAQAGAEAITGNLTAAGQSIFGGGSGATVGTPGTSGFGANFGALGANLPIALPAALIAGFALRRLMGGDSTKPQMFNSLTAVQRLDPEFTGDLQEANRIAFLAAGHTGVGAIASAQQVSMFGLPGRNITDQMILDARTKTKLGQNIFAEAQKNRNMQFGGPI